METLNFQCIARSFNSTHDINFYDKFVSYFYRDVQKCRKCGNHIIYYDTQLHYKETKNGLQFSISGKSYQSKKIDYSLCICEKCLTDEFPSYGKSNKSRVFNRMCEETKYAFNIPNDVYEKEKRKFVVRTEESFIEKFGKTEGIERWNAYRNKQSVTNTFEYKNLKYGMSRAEFDAYNRSRAVTLNNMSERHGGKGTVLFNDYVEKQKNTKSLKYMIDKYGYKTAMNINKSKANTLDNFIKRYGDVEKGTKKYTDYANKSRSFYSKISQTFCLQIDKYLSHHYTTYFATKNGEYAKMLKTGYTKMDYFIKELNLCVEFFGTYFHGDPRVFSENECPNFYAKNTTAKMIWDSDTKRSNLLKEMYNINTIVIWELDYDEKTFDAKKFIKETLKINI